MIKLNTAGAASNTYLITFSEIPRPREVPCRLTPLNTLPSATLACAIHLSIAAFTQLGIGTVRT